MAAFLYPSLKMDIKTSENFFCPKRDKIQNQPKYCFFPSLKFLIIKVFKTNMYMDFFFKGKFWTKIHQNVPAANTRISTNFQYFIIIGLKWTTDIIGHFWPQAFNRPGGQKYGFFFFVNFFTQKYLCSFSMSFFFQLLESKILKVT